MNIRTTLMLTAVASAFCATAYPQEEKQESTAPKQLMTEVNNWPAQPTVKVKLLQDVEGALLEVKGGYNVYDPNTGDKISRAFMSSNYYVYPTIDGLKWGQEFPGTYQFVIVPDRPSTSILVDGVEYKGVVYIYQIDGTIGAVNELSLEDLTATLLSQKLPEKGQSKEVLSALAIALRTDILAVKNRAKNRFWDVDAKAIGFSGSSLLRIDLPFKEAMKSTKGMVLVDRSAKEGKVYKTTWFEKLDAPVPQTVIETNSKDSDDARIILNNYFPKTAIELVQTTAQ